jgi:hypothetical protein
VNVAYIISAYKLPDLLLRLVRRLDGPRSSFFIHVDARTPDDEFAAFHGPLAATGNVTFLERHACYWGDFGHVEATLKGLRASLGASREVDYVVLLTGQDYPLAPASAIESRLASLNGGILMEHFRLPSARWTDGGMDRIEHRQFRLGGRLHRFPGQPFASRRLAAAWMRAARGMGMLRSFPGGLVPYGGSSYWSMPAACGRYVLDFVDDNPKLVHFFRQTTIPDEMFFQTVVLNSPFRERVRQDDLRFIDWSADADSPGVITSDHFEALMRSGRFFARKFDPTIDVRVLDMIDRAIDAVDGDHRFQNASLPGGL